MGHDKREGSGRVPVRKDVSPPSLFLPTCHVTTHFKHKKILTHTGWTSNMVLPYVKSHYNIYVLAPLLWYMSVSDL